MTRDYKNRSAKRRKPRRAPKRRAGSGAPPWMWLFAGFATGLIAAAGIYMLHDSTFPAPPDAADSPSPQPARAVKLEEPQPVAGARVREEAEPAPESRYTFYDRLPAFELIIPETERDVRRDQPAKPVAKPGAYVLQVGSFRNFADADRRKAELALQGIESRVQKVTIDNDQTWHRVRVGPIDELAELNRMRAQLADADLQFLVIRVGN